MQDATATQKPRVALLVDAENISAEHWPRIQKAAGAFGVPRVLTCVGDFAVNRLPGWIEVCRRWGGRATMVLASGDRHNGSDIALTIEAMDLIHAGAADVIVIVSNDGDFAPLALKITATGRTAVGMGLSHASEGLRRAFDHFITLEKPVPAQKPKPKPAPTAPKAPADLDAEQKRVVKRLIERLSGEDVSGSVALNQLGVVLHKEYPAIAALLGKGRLLKALRRHGLAAETGSGSTIRVSPRTKPAVGKAA